MPIEIIVISAIFLLIFFYIGIPFFNKIDSASIDLNQIELDNLVLQKEEIITTLKDLELDFQMQKISKNDYEKMHQEAVYKGAELLKKIEGKKQ